MVFYLSTYCGRPISVAWRGPGNDLPIQYVMATPSVWDRLFLQRPNSNTNRPTLSNNRLSPVAHGQSLIVFITCSLLLTSSLSCQQSKACIWFFECIVSRYHKCLIYIHCCQAYMTGTNRILVYYPHLSEYNPHRFARF